MRIAGVLAWFTPRESLPSPRVVRQRCVELVRHAPHMCGIRNRLWSVTDDDLDADAADLEAEMDIVVTLTVLGCYSLSVGVDLCD